MKSFTEVLEEAAGKGLTVFDIDDTFTYVTTARRSLTSW